MKKHMNLIIAIVLGVLLLLSVVQAFQINSIREKVASGGLSAVGPSVSGGANVPSSLQNLPTMVGGC